jgi:hypothetical protein
MNFIISPLIASILYMVYKIIDMKYISKEEQSFKTILKDSVIVFLAGLASVLILEQMSDFNILDNPKGVLSAFTNAPDF